MNTRKYIRLFIIGIAVLPILVIAESFPSFPMALLGKAIVNGSLAPVGSVVRAYSLDVLVGEVVIQGDETNGYYGYSDLDKQKLLVGDTSGTISFSIQHSSLNSGIEIFSPDTELFVGGSTIYKDISFNFTISQSLGNVPSGGGSFFPSLLSVSGGDTNNDGGVDLLDFNVLMINWGKNETNNLADFNKDGMVDIFDFNLLMVNWT